jgi:hypothetical protein
MGDPVGMVLALATLYALRSRWRLAIPLAWVFLTFYVPALWVSLVLVVWQPWTRRGERLANS